MEEALKGNKKGTSARNWRMPFLLLPVAFFFVELFAFAFLSVEGMALWPLAFGAVWAVMLSAALCVIPWKASRIAFGVVYFLFVAYTAVQTGYYILFRQMMWVAEFRYASEGAEFFSVLLQYPIGWWLYFLALIVLGVVLIWKYPARKKNIWWNVAGAVTAIACAVTVFFLPRTVFQHDRQVLYAGSDYGRAQSAEAAYTNMFNAHRLYQVCGIYQTPVKDLYQEYIYPALPGYAAQQAAAIEEIDAYMQCNAGREDNPMTGCYQGKNVIYVLMESMDDWALGEHTPTINRMMQEGINFTNFYTPGYGGVRTFNTEFCANTGTFLSSQSGYAFDYVTNDFRQSLASQLVNLGYTAKVYHYNTPDFYSRGVFSPAMGYQEYVCYEDYVTERNQNDLYDDQFLFDNTQVSESFFRDGQKLNFIITRSAHLSYKYNEVLSHWGLKKYPQYRGLTGNEEEDCMYLKARLVDDMFARLLQELESHGELENTVIVAFTDHYSYGFKNESLMMERSGVDDLLLLEKTPCFIWSADKPSITVEKTLNTADLLPTVLNMLGIDSDYQYIGKDAFDPNYVGYVLFPNGSWISRGVAYSVNSRRMILLDPDAQASETLSNEMANKVNDFVRINNLILQTDYYAYK